MNTMRAAEVKALRWGKTDPFLSGERSLPDTSTGALEPQGRKTLRANESFFGEKK